MHIDNSRKPTALHSRREGQIPVYLEAVPRPERERLHRSESVAVKIRIVREQQTGPGGDPIAEVVAHRTVRRHHRDQPPTIMTLRSAQRQLAIHVQ